MRPTAALRWLSVGQAPPTDEDASRLWRQCVLADPSSSVHLHPDVVLASRRNGEDPPLVYARWQRAHGEARLASLAVLPTRNLTIRPLPLIPWQVHLRSRRLLDNHLLGDASEESLHSFADAAAGMLTADEADCVEFQDLATGSPLHAALVAAARRHGVSICRPIKPAPHWWIRFPEKPEQYWSQFSKKTRYNFRYRAKHLPHTIRCVRDEGDVPMFVERIQDLTRRTWQYQRLGRGFVDVDRELASRRRIAALGAFRSYLLEQGDRVLAYATGIQWRGCFVYEETGYDPAYAGNSPGQVLLYRVIEDLIAHDTPDLFDFGFGDSEYKRIFANHQTLSGPVLLVRRAWRPLLATKLQQCRGSLGRAARGMVQRARILPALRRIYRGRRDSSRPDEAPPTQALD